MIVDTLERFYRNFLNLRRLFPFKEKFIFNLDETFLQICENKEKVAWLKGTELPVRVGRVKSEHITLVLCVSATGVPVRPLLILPPFDASCCAPFCSGILLYHWKFFRVDYDTNLS